MSGWAGFGARIRKPNWSCVRWCIDLDTAFVCTTRRYPASRTSCCHVIERSSSFMDAFGTVTTLAIRYPYRNRTLALSWRSVRASIRKRRASGAGWPRARPARSTQRLRPETTDGAGSATIALHQRSEDRSRATTGRRTGPPRSPTRKWAVSCSNL